jgi:hypothetical protein
MKPDPSESLHVIGSVYSSDAYEMAGQTFLVSVIDPTRHHVFTTLLLCNSIGVIFRAVDAQQTLIIYVVILWVMIPCSVEVIEFQRNTGLCLNHQGRRVNQACRKFPVSWLTLSFWRWKQSVPPKIQ